MCMLMLSVLVVYASVMPWKRALCFVFDGRFGVGIGRALGHWGRRALGHSGIGPQDYGELEALGICVYCQQGLDGMNLRMPCNGLRVNMYEGTGIYMGVWLEIALEYGQTWV